MLLTSSDAELFFRLHFALMCFVNERLQIKPGVRTPREFAALSPDVRVEVRQTYLQHPELLEAFVETNPAQLGDVELEIVRSWKHQVHAKFFVLRYLKKHAIFLSGDPPVAYGVVALHDPFENLLGRHLPVWTETVLLPFRGRIVYDGLLSTYNISFGGGIRRTLSDDYTKAKARQGVVTSLPLGEPAPSLAKTPRKRPAAPSRARHAPNAAESIRRVVGGMVDGFCRERLNDEYAALCLKAVDQLARKKPSPLLNGRPATWAAGIVRPIGWVNFLDDRDAKPHLRSTEIDKAFGVGSSTGQNKSLEIRKLLRIRPYDHKWMLPSRIDDDPMVWMLEVNGMIQDIRDCPRAAQEAAFEQGLIPYIPAAPA